MEDNVLKNIIGTAVANFLEEDLNRLMSDVAKENFDLNKENTVAYQALMDKINSLTLAELIAQVEIIKSDK